MTPQKAILDSTRTLFVIRILSTSLISVSIFSVCCCSRYVSLCIDLPPLSQCCVAYPLRFFLCGPGSDRRFGATCGNGKNFIELLNFSVNHKIGWKSEVFKPIFVRGFSPSNLWFKAYFGCVSGSREMIHIEASQMPYTLGEFFKSSSKVT
jgi:hypothetical protein